MPSAAPNPRGPTVLTLYEAADLLAVPGCSVCRYLAYLDHIRPLRAGGLRFCYPEVSAGSKEVLAAETFDLALAHKLTLGGKPVVTNGFRLAGAERVLVVTGPNQGGKTTFARTFGPTSPAASAAGRHAPPTSCEPSAGPTAAGTTSSQ